MKTDIKYTNEVSSKYITHVFINDQRVIPSDSFVIGKDEYLLLEILTSSEGIMYLKIIGVEGKNMGNIYFIPKKEFENKSLLEIDKSLKNYQH